MIRLRWEQPQSVADVQRLVQKAINLEFATLPPYLYAKFSLLPQRNPAASSRLDMIVGQEMIHMCLACNILNAIGGTPAITPPRYPGPLPGDINAGLIIHLLPFSEKAMDQGMAIEEPSQPVQPMLAATADGSITIGEYYQRLDAELAKLPTSAWTPHRNQVDDAQFFQGQLFAVNAYADAHQAIQNIVSEGEGTPVSPDNPGSPLDFQNELAHYYRFWELRKNQVLTKAPSGSGYRWGEPLGVDWAAVYPAIPDPESHDFSQDSPAAQQAQDACNTAFTSMVNALSSAFRGTLGSLGVAVRAMFDLRMAALAALQIPLADGKSVAGPAFVYLDTSAANRKGDAA
jgi:Ferritin-like